MKPCKGYNIFDVDNSGILKLQRCDMCNAHKSDSDAVITAVNDTLNGDMTAARMIVAVLLQDSDRVSLHECGGCHHA